MSPFRPFPVRGKLVAYTQIVNYFSEVAKNIFTIQRVLAVISERHLCFLPYRLETPQTQCHHQHCGLLVPLRAVVVVVGQGDDTVFCWIIN
jgi:hypothetical protein